MDIEKKHLALVARRLKEKGGKVRWPWIGDALKEGRKASKREANKFLLASSLDRQYTAEIIVGRTRKLVEKELGDPPKLWECIAGFRGKKWDRVWSAHYINPRFCNVDKGRVRNNARYLVENYGGDARNIWDGGKKKQILARLRELEGVGCELANMIVGALKDTKQISIMKASVKRDVHVRRVVGRVFLGKSCTVALAEEITQGLYPDNPWKADGPLYSLGRKHCHSNKPDCESCYLNDLCVRYQG